MGKKWMVRTWGGGEIRTGLGDWGSIWVETYIITCFSEVTGPYTKAKNSVKSTQGEKDEINKRNLTVERKKRHSPYDDGGTQKQRDPSLKGKSTSFISI